MMRNSILCAVLAAPLYLSADAGEPEASPHAVLLETADHAGPTVAPGESGPARFAAALHRGFRTDRAMDLASYIDGYYRTPGGEGYDKVLDRVARELGTAGYGDAEGFSLRFIETPMITPAWTPRSGSFEVHLPGCPPLPLHRFRHASDTDRVMLPIHAPSADVRGPLALSLDDVVEGSILVTTDDLNRRTIDAARRKGAVAVLSSAVFDFTVDPTGGDRHLDAIQFQSVAAGTETPVGKVSRRTQQLLAGLLQIQGSLEVSFRAEVSLEVRPLRTLVAEVVGSERPDECVAVVSHVQEPGAGDNASGVAGLCESAGALARAIRTGELERPSRSLAFVFGDEMRQSAIFLKDTSRTVVAGISADMLGQSTAATGAVPLLERTPDPGALHTLPPDAHTAWGAGNVTAEDLVPNGVAVVARCALRDVAGVEGAWKTAENPWEGGSDHDVFISYDIPAVLFWHFTDFTYHTGLDRMEMLDSAELRRMSTAVMSCALALADPKPADLERYRGSLELEREMRVASARAVGSTEAETLWNTWCDGVGAWFDDFCAAPSEDD
ncbi:MAG: M28 family peptidase [Planctomycetes bacterium]|nr:M28 family peptidase [Planctomycetota bacterium]MCB9903444.1 M28 family peptidase [Planctomycetota bacterium]